MINLLISIAVGLVVSLLFKVTFVDSYWALLIPFIGATGGMLFYLGRQVNQELQALMMKVQEKLQTLSPTVSPTQRDEALAEVIQTLEGGFELGKKQFLVTSQIHAQIGQLYYMQKKFKSARPHLEKAFSRNWISKAMLACLHYQDKKYDEMKAVFENLTKYSPKESMMWNLYAWCVWKSGDRDGAQSILARGQTALPNDERIDSNLNAIRNKKAIKMRGWKEQWYMFHLEPPPRPKMTFRKGRS